MLDSDQESDNPKRSPKKGSAKGEENESEMSLLEAQSHTIFSLKIKDLADLVDLYKTR